MNKAIYSRIRSCDFLPSLPHVVAELMQASLSDKTSIRDIAKIIQNDPSLTGHVLKLVNSPFYGLNRKITTPAQAIVVLGLRAVQNVSLTASVFRTFHGKKEKVLFSIEQFWWHSLACTMMAKRLSEKLHFGNDDEAFVAGLLHDIGKLVLCTNFPSDYEMVMKRHHEGEPLIQVEEDLFGANHADVGAWVLDSWNLQPFVVDAVRYHHQQPERIISALPIVRLIYLANMLSHAMFETRPEDGLGKEAEEALKLLGISLTDVDQLRQELLKDVRDFAECMGLALGDPDVLPSSNSICRHVEDLSEKKQKELHGRIKDISILLGMLRALLEAKDSQEVIDIAFEVLSMLFSFESALLMLVNGHDKKLAGKRAFGTRQDHLAGQIVIELGAASAIWRDSLRSQSVTYSEEFFKSHTRTIIDEQMKNYLQAQDFAVVPLSYGGEALGALVVPAGRKSIGSHEDLLQTLAAYTAASLRTHRLRGELSEADRFNRAIVHHAPVGLISTDENGVVTRCNRMAKTMFELPVAEEVVGLPFDALRLQPDLKQALSPLFSGRSQEVAAFEYHAPSGKTYWLQARGASLEDEKGATGRLILVEDVTERVQAEEVLRDYAETLEERIKEKTRALEESQAMLVRSERIAAAGRLAGKVAHEVNNPLGIIRNYLQIMARRMPENDPQKESIRIIDEEIDRIASIVRHLLDYTRADVLSFQRLDVSHILEDLVIIMRESYREQGIDMILDLSETPAYANVDADKIKQVLINLVKNAAEAMPTGGEVKLATSVTRREEGTFVSITVTDTGTGIPEDALQNIFDPFYSTKGLTNTGLGLSVSRGLVKAHHGDITVQSSVGKGTTFTVLLPAA